MTILAGIIRMLLFVVASLITVPLAWILREITGNVRYCQLFHETACRIFNIRVVRMGRPREYAQTPTVFLSNHLSYLDIIVLGSFLEARFVAKSEVEGWPVFGAFAKVQRTVFIKRTKTAMEDAKTMIGDVLRDDTNVILFGEGTSTDGRTVLPFKAGLLEMLYGDGINAMLQPVAIVIENAGGKSPDDQTSRDLYAWWQPEAEMFPHLWNFAKNGGATIAVHFLEPLDPKNFPDRKALAQAATQAVARVLA